MLGLLEQPTIHPKACVPSPYALLTVTPTQGHLSMNPHSADLYSVQCYECILTNCVSPRGSVNTVLLVKQPPHVMLPIKGKLPWCDDIGLLQALQEINLVLSRSKCFVASLILGITALIAIVESFTASTVALVQQVHTTHHVNQLTKNVSYGLATQEIIDRQSNNKENALEEAILYLGNELHSLKVQLSLQCHKEYRWVCVTLLKHSTSTINVE